ncbi:MAG: hypothetical protein ACI8UO_004071 [Verrucomicrobiales bacterium]|jgi:hypothetical protein
MSDSQPFRLEKSPSAAKKAAAPKREVVQQLPAQGATVIFNGGKKKVVVAKKAAQPKPGASQAVARIMDELIPLSKDMKVGLDPVVGLLPIGGDLMGASISCVSLIEAIRWGLPFSVIWRILGNIVLNTGIGTIPIIGDIFSFIFRSNSRNRDLIRTAMRDAKLAGQKPRWFRVFLAVIFVMSLVAGAIWVNIKIWGAVFNFIFTQLKDTLFFWL